MSVYKPEEIEGYWQDEWKKNKTYQTSADTDKPKYYVLDMFPYPSGAGLHVGHPLGYIASDIVARYKRAKGFNVLHPMGFDAFGLPAEQYAIQTGQHPEKTTKENIARYKEQLDKIGFSYDWDRQVKTSDPEYYKWTQWIFIQLYHSWYDENQNKARPVSSLIELFEEHGYMEGNEFLSGNIEIAFEHFTAEQWKHFSELEKENILQHFRLAYQAETFVNWCPELGSVLSNEEVVNGVSERGGYPVERKKMLQWNLRITAYADRLLSGLETIDWSDAIKEQQRNWIGKSTGAEIDFKIASSEKNIKVFTTRPDTIFGCTFMVLAPEHELVKQICTPEQKSEIDAYVHYVSSRSERERMTEVKKVTGAFTGAYAVHPFTGKQIPVWISEYVLVGYGTGAIMAVPAHDGRDYAFARHFNLEIKPVIKGGNIDEEAYETKEGEVFNSEFLDGLNVKGAIEKAVTEIEHKNIGKRKTNFRLRDAIFGRQRYWGEPIPVYYKNGIPQTLPEDKLPLILPEVDKFLPTETGEPPLARAKDWNYEGHPYEHSTMPGWAGSSWYFLRYMNPDNSETFASKEAMDYWKQVDLYLGGSEHATGHLLYARFWTKFLYDLGYISFDEPFKKLINQGMIQGMSSIAYLLTNQEFEVAVETNEQKLQTQQLLEDLKLSHENPNPTLMQATGNYISRNIFISKGIYEDLKKGIYPNDIEQKYNFKKYGVELGSMINPRPIHVDVNIVKNNILDINTFKQNSVEYKDSIFITETENGKEIFVCDSEVEKMSKRWFNVVNPDDICNQYGADTLRLYEMFLGPLELSKPWNTNGIEGVYRFLGKLWRLFFDKEGNFVLSDEEPTKAEYKILHKTIKKTIDDIEGFSFNTNVSAFMIAVNELAQLACNKRKILEPLLVIIAPYAPHIAEELWKKAGHDKSITKENFPEFNPEYLIENSFDYPVSINGKTRTTLTFALDATEDIIKNEVLENELVKKYMEDKPLKKFILVKGRIINVVI